LIQHAEGVHLHLEDGSKLIDAMSSWWCVIHGYNQPDINQAVKEQVEQFSHVMFGGLTHEPGIQLAQTLLDLKDGYFDQVFFADSGSVAVEVAMKMALQYQYAVGQARKQKFLTIRSGYHGDTWRAMSVCDPDTGMHHLFKGALPVEFFVSQPPIRFDQEWVEDEKANGVGELRAALETNHEQIAAMILEPIVQGAGGMYFYHPEYLPDIVCMGKALTGGYMSLAATLATERIAVGIASKEPGVLMQGPTFMGNPLSCAAANASLEILAQGHWRKQIANIESQLRAELLEAQNLPHVVDTRALGSIGVIEMDHVVSANQAHALCHQLGVWLRPFGKCIYTMPPYVISTQQLSKVTRAMIELAKVL